MYNIKNTNKDFIDKVINNWKVFIPNDFAPVAKTYEIDDIIEMHLIDIKASLKYIRELSLNRSETEMPNNQVFQAEECLKLIKEIYNFI